MAIDVAPWLLRDYDPVGTYLKAFQTGASISAEQTRLAEQQRQANMDYMAKQEAMQQNILKAQVELQMEKSYREQRMSLENAQLEETKRRNTMVAEQAANDLKERLAYHQAVMDAKSQSKEYGDIQAVQLPGGEWGYYRPGSPGLHIGQGDKQLESQQKRQERLQWLELQNTLKEKSAAEKEASGAVVMPEQRAQAEAKAKALGDKYASLASAITNAPSMKQASVDKFTSEDEARSAGHKAGDVVYIVGVGKVRLR